MPLLRSRSDPAIAHARCRAPAPPISRAPQRGPRRHGATRVRPLCSARYSRRRAAESAAQVSASRDSRGVADRRTTRRHEQSICTTTPLRQQQAADQGFHPTLTMDGILSIHPSDTPENPRSETCDLISSDTTKPRPRRRRRSGQGLCKTCRRGDFNPKYTRPLDC